MGTTIIAKGADFSGSNVGNVFYPFYPDLIAARFYGSAVVGGAALKKSSVVGPVTAGPAGPVDLEAYAAVPKDGQQFDTEIAIPTRRGTIIFGRSLSGNQNNGYGKVGGTEPLVATGAQAGNCAFQDYAFGRILSRAQVSGAGKTLDVASANLDTTQEQHVLSFLSYDADANAVTYEIWVNGSVSRDATTFNALTSRNMRVEDSFAGVLKARHVAVLGIPLNETQRKTARDWLRNHYGNRGVALG